jgi:phosphatidylinositol dimannoside acyltransferase
VTQVEPIADHKRQERTHHSDAPTVYRALSLHRSVRSRLRGASLRVAAVVMDLASRVLRWLPGPYRYLSADAITVPLSYVWPRRRVVEENYALMLGMPAQSSRVRTLARLSIRNFGRMAVDFLTVRTMAPHEVLAWASSQGVPEFEEAQSRGRGVIFALPHAGSWDVAAAYAQALGLKLAVVTESNWVTELVAGSRANQGATLVPRNRSLRGLFQARQRGECVVMLSDFAHEAVQTMQVPFFGRPASFPMGPARIAQRTGAPILVITSVRRPDGGYLIAAGATILADKAKPAGEEIARLTAEIVRGFERIIREYPEQWYPFSRIWDDQKSPQA